MQKKNEEIFKIVRAHYNRQHWQTTIVWANPIKISVAATSDLGQKHPTLEKQWQVENDEFTHVQKLLKDAIERQIHNGSEFVLELTTQSGRSNKISYDFNREPDLLKSIREKFETSSHMHFAEASFAFSLGEKLQERNMLKEAIGLFRAGIDTLGDRYTGSEMFVDDTDARLIDAEHSYKDGNLEQSAALYNGVLESRLQIYQHWNQ